MAEMQLGLPLPGSLSEFLQASNGFVDVEDQYEYAWGLETIVAENRRAWSDSAMRLDEGMLAFGGDGAGDWFCLPVDAANCSVYHWGWIEAEAREIAPTLLAFWPGWLRGSISV
jgi:SMI1 / KNR4 family (SUKH-1)